MAMSASVYGTVDSLVEAYEYFGLSEVGLTLSVKSRHHRPILPLVHLRKLPVTIRRKGTLFIAEQLFLQSRSS